MSYFQNFLEYIHEDVETDFGDTPKAIIYGIVWSMPDEEKLCLIDELSKLIESKQLSALSGEIDPIVHGKLLPQDDLLAEIVRIRDTAKLVVSEKLGSLSLLYERLDDLCSE